MCILCHEWEFIKFSCNICEANRINSEKNKFDNFNVRWSWNQFLWAPDILMSSHKCTLFFPYIKTSCSSQWLGKMEKLWYLLERHESEFSFCFNFVSILVPDLNENNCLVSNKYNVRRSYWRNVEHNFSVSGMSPEMSWFLHY